jgi:hypothetical protein
MSFHKNGTDILQVFLCYATATWTNIVDAHEKGNYKLVADLHLHPNKSNMYRLLQSYYVERNVIYVNERKYVVG